jgi:hypothetical protein
MSPYSHWSRQSHSKPVFDRYLVYHLETPCVTNETFQGVESDPF